MAASHFEGSRTTSRTEPAAFITPAEMNIKEPARRRQHKSKDLQRNNLETSQKHPAKKGLSADVNGAETEQDPASRHRHAKIQLRSEAGE